MLLSKKTKETFYMTIIPKKAETLDTILKTSANFTKEFIRRRLEKYDLEIYCSIDKRRFELVGMRGRTLLTSYGVISYRRRYYFDNLEERYVHLLDNQLEIPSNARMSNELLLRILDLASTMTYQEVGRRLSDEFTLSKSTVWKAIHDAVVEAAYPKDVGRGGKIHLQIDEKFIGMVGSGSKKRYYTATIFAGKEEGRLLNKTVLSSANLSKLKARINEHLRGRYKVGIDEEIFVSGDLATYIQNFRDGIMACKSRYVPDKFHVYHAIRAELPDVHVDDISLNERAFQDYLIKELGKKDGADARKVARLLKREPTAFGPYLDPEYLGCSQEGQNSHIYAPRFGKYANRFSKDTIEKLSLIREAEAMGCVVKIANARREIARKVDLGIVECDFSDPVREMIDTSGMKRETRKMFDAIRYGVE